MKLQLEIADRLRTVEVQRQGTGYLVTVDGHRRLVEAARIGADAWSLIVRDEAGGEVRSVEAIVPAHSGNGALDVHIDGYRIPVHLRQGRGRTSRDTMGSHGAGSQRVGAPMPGKVIRVLVKPGDVVKPRQVLVVVEAMKMENELRALRAGTVRAVLVSEGQSVDAGTPLVVVE
jgi:biotin carboxyl carrier protein